MNCDGDCGASGNHAMNGVLNFNIATVTESLREVKYGKLLTRESSI